MKKYKIKQVLTLSFLFMMMFGLTSLFAQKKETNFSNEISYRVTNSALNPIFAESTMLNTSITLNDDTNELEKVNFDVSVNTFNGLNSDYLAWVGGFANPNLKFEGDSIEKINDEKYRVSGRLHFRNNSRPIQIVMRKKKSSNQFVLTGNFNLRARDFFIGRSVSRRLVPTWIPFNFTIAFDKSDIV